MERKPAKQVKSLFVPLTFWLILILSILTIMLVGTNLATFKKVKPLSFSAVSLKSPKPPNTPIVFPSSFPPSSPKSPNTPIPLPSDCHYVPILMYHHIGPPKNWLYVDTQTFAQQMDYLAGKGYTTLSLPEILNNLRNNSWPNKSVAITFDDGYRDVFENAYPVLNSRGLKATFFIITQLAEGADYMTWGQIKEIANNPLMTIGDHTLTHRPLNSLSEAQVKDEILSSQKILESQTGKKIDTFAYPYGSWTPIDVQYLQEGGFAAAVNTLAGASCASNPYGLRRLRIGRSPLSSYGL